MKVILVPAAQSDLETIGDFIARENPLRAASFLHELLDRCDGLAKFPRRFPIAEQLARSGVRKCVHGNYLIFYRITADQIDVVHILHGSTDYQSFFEEGEK